MEKIKLRGFDTEELIAKDTLKIISKKSRYIAFSIIGLDMLLVVIAAVISEIYWHPVTYVIVLMFIGARLIGVGSIVLHEGVHGLICLDRQLNDKVSRILSPLLFIPIIVSFDNYRQLHFRHHSQLNTSEDPDRQTYINIYKMSRGKLLQLMLLTLSGFSFLVLCYRFFKNRLKSQILLSTSLLLLSIGFVITLFLGSYPTQLFALYWVIPIATWGFFVNNIRVFAEHYPPEKELPMVFQTRDTINTLFDSIFVVTRNVNLHLSHHLFPHVPFYNLPKLQKEIASSNLYQQNANVTHGYVRFLREFFSNRSDENNSASPIDG